MKTETFVDKVLDTLYLAAQFVPRPFESKYAWARRLKNIDPDKAYRTLYHLRRRGMVNISTKKGKIFLSLTSKGQLQALLNKAKNNVEHKWDGKWRLITYDIPEDQKPKRKLFRTLLRQNSFKKLQASVYISPYPLNREGIEYLKQSGLMSYIRILRVDEIDDDIELKKLFKLK